VVVMARWNLWAMTPDGAEHDSPAGRQLEQRRLKIASADADQLKIQAKGPAAPSGSGNAW